VKGRPIVLYKPTDETTIKLTAGVGSPLDQGNKVNPPRDQCSKLIDILEVPQRQRNAGAYRHLATLMVELGWSAVCVRDLTRGGYEKQVRGYVRHAFASR
jgi:hypothetical protein